MGGFILHKVFAVLLFTLLLFSCTKSSGNSELEPINTVFKNNAIYTSPGDFDGDGKMESIFITKPDGNFYISVVDKDNTVYKKLNYKADDFKLTIQDINNDKKEDIIINMIQNNCENCYVYTLDTDLINILSPELIKSKINQQNIVDYISLECGSFKLSRKFNSISNIKLYYTEMDYTGDEPVFTSEGSVYDKGIVIASIQTTIGIDKNCNIIVKNINMLSEQKRP